MTFPWRLLLPVAFTIIGIPAAGCLTGGTLVPLVVLGGPAWLLFEFWREVRKP